MIATVGFSAAGFAKDPSNYDRENEMYAVEKRNVHLCWGGRHGWRQNEMCIFSEFFGVEAGRCRVYHGMINPRLNGNQTRVNC